MDTVQDSFENGFRDRGIQEHLVQKLAKDGKHSPTLVQTQIIPLILAGNQVIFQSETGTGKTLAYLLPLLQQLDPADTRIQVIIAAPTHELASQIKREAQKISDCGVVLCIGSTPIRRQIDLIKEKPALAAGNPARLSELINLYKLKPDGIRALVLDEADRLFAPEQARDTAALIAQMPAGVQLIACSATIREKTRRAIERSLAENPGRAGLPSENSRKIEVLLLPPEDVLRCNIEHQAIFSEGRDKIDTLRKYLAAVTPQKALVFIAKAAQTGNIVSRLWAKQIDCAGIHAGMDKLERKQAIDRFRSGKTRLLVTSDLSARGLDIPGITHIIQLDFPSDDDFFIHRAGRTARAGASGINVVIGDEWELRCYAGLEKKLGITVYPKVLYGGRLETA
ncbi:MAG: DEAD/DEAH box helicase [Treponema sp.]|nr:DEAD/DEAH box helicase [Treponema sp.]